MMPVATQSARPLSARPLLGPTQKGRRGLGALNWTLLISLVLHASVVLATLSRPIRVPAGEELRDAWLGETLEVDAIAEQSAEAAPAPEPAELSPSPASAIGPSAPAVVHDPKPSVSPGPRAVSVVPSRRSHSRRPGAPHPSGGRETAVGVAPGAGSATATTSGAAGSAAPLGSVRELARALARALPAAVSEGQGGWNELPLGPQGRAWVTLELEPSGEISEVTFEEPPAPSPRLARLVRRSVKLLGTGRFAVGATGGSAASRQSFLLTASVAQEPPLGDEFSDPQHILKREFEAPTQDKPGRAAFTYASGRRVEIRIEITKSPAH